jgi:HK97 family phage portal protein
MKIFGIEIMRQHSTPRLEERGISATAAEWLAGGGSGAEGLSNSYEQVVWVYRAINALAEQVANVPFVFSRGERGREALINSGPLLDFYRRPNPQVNRFQYWELRVMWLMLRGECVRVPIFDVAANGSGRRRLRRVLLADPARFQHVVVDHQLAGWRYLGADSRSPLAAQVFLPEEIWFERLPNPFDPWRGLAPLRVAAMAAGAEYAAAALRRGELDNNGEAGLLVRAKTPLSAPQQEQLLSALRQRKRGGGCVDRPVILNGCSEVIRPDLASSDAQFLAHRKFSRAEICAAFGVPEEILTATEHSKYDVMEGARLNFIENRVAPLCARLEAEEEVAVRALDPEAMGWFDLDSLPIMQQARRQRLAAAKTGFEMGVPFNELNQVLDLGFRPLPWGDQGFLPSGLAGVGKMPAANPLLGGQKEKIANLLERACALLGPGTDAERAARSGEATAIQKGTSSDPGATSTDPQPSGRAVALPR